MGIMIDFLGHNTHSIMEAMTEKTTVIMATIVMGIMSVLIVTRHLYFVDFYCNIQPRFSLPHGKRLKKFCSTFAIGMGSF